MRFDIGKFHLKAKIIFNREKLADYEQRVVAFVLDSKGSILTEGWNSYSKTHPMMKIASDAFNEYHKQFMHAEIHALSRLKRSQLDKKDTIVVLRLNSNKALLPGKPCRCCSKFIKDFGIKNIIHS
jgi:tRNA(Arg) A34 adenosine deaminase TadA